MHAVNMRIDMGDVRNLPSFRYHPDPVGSGSIIRSTDSCSACGHARGFIYDAVSFADDDTEIRFCPWCIADGTAHGRYGIHFCPPENVGGRDGWRRVSSQIAEEVSFRTPSFAAWQDDYWWTHCGDAAAFEAPMTIAKAEVLSADLIKMLRTQAEGEGYDWDEIAEIRRDDNGFTVYVFRCLTCREYGGYYDCT